VLANRRAIAVSSAFIPVIRMAILVGFLCTFVVGGLQALSGELNVGAYGVLVFLTQRLLWPLTDLAKTVDLFERAMASTRRILALIEHPISIRDTGLKTLPQPVQGKINFNNLSFRYSSSRAGLDTISLSIPAGTTTALVGTTGSGKSTLIKLLLRFYEPEHGQILIDNINVQDLTLKCLRDNIGFVSQDIFLFDGNIGENIAYAQPSSTTEAIINAAQAAEAWDFISELPNGLDTPIGERGVRLSGGQRQRISLARAILKNSPILVLDEATSAVDNETEAAIQRSLAHLSKDRTLIVIAHRLSTIVNSHNIVVLKAGKIIEMGQHHTLLNAGGEYARQWSVQTGAASETTE